jgi:hypothetical protein
MKPTSKHVPFMGEEVVAGLKNLVRYFAPYLQGPSCTHRYVHMLACGGEAFVEYTQCKKAALVALGWLRPCRCESESAEKQCDRELNQWVEHVESCEQQHFQFRRKGSFTLDLGETGMLIFHPEAEQMETDHAH